MKVVHFCHSFSRLTETFIYDYVTGLEEHGVDNWVFTLNRVNKEDRPFPKVEVISLSLWNVKRIWYRIISLMTGDKKESSSWPIYRVKLKKKLEQLKPDIVHAHFGPMGVLVNEVCNELDIPLFVTFYGYDISQNIKDEFWVRKYEELAQTVAGVTVLSEEMKTDASDVGFPVNKIYVVHLGVRIDRFSYSAPNHSIKEFLSVGRLSDKKGHLDTIKAVETLKEEGVHLKLNIIGGGEDQNKLLEYIKNHKLTDFITLMGRLPHNEVAQAMKNADAFILCSKTAANGDREGTPTVLIEAMASGLPCISTFHSGIPEIFPKENHRFLAQEADVIGIVYCIKQLMGCSQSELQQISEVGRTQIENHFNTKGETKKLKSIYQQCLLNNQ